MGRRTLQCADMAVVTRAVSLTDCKGQVYFPGRIIIHHVQTVRIYFKTLPIRCSSLLHEEVPTVVRDLLSVRELFPVVGYGQAYRIMGGG